MKKDRYGILRIDTDQHIITYVDFQELSHCDSCEGLCAERFGHSGYYTVHVMPNISKHEHTIPHEVYVIEL